ncbi:MICOS complex subunit mic25-a [Takifugu flavidus]|uniref:MICOS complex subunit mic25-a n=1 Tax=Takifugu flavidus TaxID=433684 RepID=A0A5C6NC12_9TELE|nr:MICOS complex subunit mic25-a [Takifugu flavidus]
MPPTPLLWQLTPANDHIVLPFDPEAVGCGVTLSQVSVGHHSDRWAPAKQLSAREADLQKQDAFYREQVARLEERSAQFYKVTTENYHKAADQVNAKYKRYEIHPVCADLQGRILTCYKENAGKTLNCSNIAALYLQCVNNAKQQSHPAWQQCPSCGDYLHSHALTLRHVTSTSPNKGDRSRETLGFDSPRREEVNTGNEALCCCDEETGLQQHEFFKARTTASKIEVRWWNWNLRNVHVGTINISGNNSHLYSNRFNAKGESSLGGGKRQRTN